jgi:hypothetical protein
MTYGTSGQKIIDYTINDNSTLLIDTTSDKIIYTYGTGTSTGYVFTSPFSKYSVFPLSQKTMPQKVFICGRLMTIGIIGSDAECIFMNDKIMIEPGLINAIPFNGRLTMSLEYADNMYHYNIGQPGGTYINYKPNSNEIDANLISVVPK